jgi:two-component system, cell cycle response regulator
MLDNHPIKTVLIVEDNDLNLKLARDLIRLNQFHCLEAENAEKALVLARTYRPDLILMDVELPGMDGLTATRILRGDPELTHIPILALTAYAMEEDKAKAAEAGCNGYITKPIDIKAFQRTLQAYLAPSIDPIGSGMRAPAGTKRPRIARGHKIMIVDDELLNVKLLAAKLSTDGYSIMTAGDGESALGKIKDELPDLILLDIMMPGMDGYEVTARLKDDPCTAGIPVVLVTALTGEAEKKKGLDAGADEFINKPINYPELEARVYSLLRLKEYQEQLGARQQSESIMVSGRDDRSCLDPNTTADDLPTVLVVEDDSTSAKLISSCLAGIPCQIETAANGEDALRIIAAKKVDVVLLDLMLPSMDGYQVCRTLKGQEATFPIQVVMITNLDDIRSKLDGIEAGTDDFLIKPVNKDELQARIRSLFRKKAFLDQLRARIDTALHAAIIDKLTGIYNHGYFQHFMTLECRRSARHRHHLSLLMIDVDHFKSFNDAYGHPAGDRALKLIARLLKASVRDIDFLARYGGEEFAVVLPYADRAAAETIADRILRAIAGHPPIPSAPHARLTVSIGISIYPVLAKSQEELIRTADLALYTAKRNGKNRYVVHTQQFGKAIRTVNTDAD